MTGQGLLPILTLVAQVPQSKNVRALSEPLTTIHIVDDDEAVRDALAVLFLSANLDARTYASAEAFLGDLPDLASACVVTDLQMPGMDGLAFSEELKARRPGTPIVLITARADSGVSDRAAALGVRLLTKPFDGEQILAAARAAVR